MIQKKRQDNHSSMCCKLFFAQSKYCTWLTNSYLSLSVYFFTNKIPTTVYHKIYYNDLVQSTYFANNVIFQQKCIHQVSYIFIS